MPYSPKAHRYFAAVCHGTVKKAHKGLSKETACELMKHGVKKDKKSK